MGAEDKELLPEIRHRVHQQPARARALRGRRVQSGKARQQQQEHRFHRREEKNLERRGPRGNGAEWRGGVPEKNRRTEEDKLNHRGRGEAVKLSGRKGMAEKLRKRAETGIGLVGWRNVFRTATEREALAK